MTTRLSLVVDDWPEVDRERLEARKNALEAQLAQGEDVKVAVHPSMADHYRERVANLREALAQENCQAEAAEIMRTLIDRIELTPVCRDGKETLSITLHGHMAGIPGLAAKAKGPLDQSDLWWTAQNWLRGPAITQTRHSWRGLERRDIASRPGR